MATNPVLAVVYGDSALKTFATIVISPGLDAVSTCIYYYEES